MITCRDMLDFITDYENAELPAAEREVFEAHLGACPPCFAYLESYRTTVELGAAAFADLDEPVGEEVPPALVEAILAARPTRRKD